MNRTRLMTMLTAVLLTALCAVSCRGKKDEQDLSEITVSLYIPGAEITRAETGFVDPTAAESIFKTLDIWVFLTDKVNDADVLVGYHHFDASLALTGLPHNTVTRFGMKLTPEMFTILTTETGTPASRPKVDVYAVMNATSAISTVPGNNATRDLLDQQLIEGFGNSPLVMAVNPNAGLPMSGVLRGVDVTGGYPVLNVSNTLWLTRAVSKIRFVFSQQGNPNPDNPDKLVPLNKNCEIVGISFDGTNNNKDCQIATSEKLFTTQSFDIVAGQYTPLNATISGQNGSSLISNDDLSILTEPEELFYQEMESAEHYEARIDAAITKASSQVGPIYIRETDKIISGTIYYRTSESETAPKEAHFSMGAGEVFSRNHSWIVYACFTEESMSLKLTIKVLPWDWNDWKQNPIDFTEGTVNVINRFTISETNPSTFYKEEVKVQGSYGFFDVKFWHTVTTDPTEGPKENILEGDILIATPVGAKLYLEPVPNTLGEAVISDAIKVYFTDLADEDTRWHYIYPNTLNPANGKVEFCRIPIAVKCNPIYLPENYGSALSELEGQYVDLHFYVEIGNGVRYIDLGSESIDYYRFILTKDWAPQTNSNENNNGNE